MKISFIGAGNMGRALASAVLNKAPKENILITNRTPEKAMNFANETGITYAENIRAFKEGFFIFLGVKPQMMEELLNEYKDILKERKDRFILVTMAAGLTTDKISQMAGCDYPIIRIMPNTPVAVGEGMTLISANPLVTENELSQFSDLLSSSGKTDIIPEELIDAGCALSGCGPAFVYMFADALAKSGENHGLSYEKARLYAEQTLKGAAKLAMSSKETLEELRINVCSPGGATIEGVKSLWNNNFEEITKNAVDAAYNRTKELNKN